MKYGYRYSYISLVVGGMTTDKYFVLGTNMKKDKENWIVFDCVPGNYYAKITPFWRSSVTEFSFSVYGPSTV